ncbi:MAG TPA: class I adenylate-forming enzyme family protein [Verrucomicrobiae bacterium]|jgi:acyl-CoA synthetase (AMP-forming)/AMP-acid ligase II|nr:class I adenylate-forming enzyme family protein [Verrucomicrobiae bacterium]
MNVFEKLARSAQQFADRTAIIDATGSMDYRTLWREVETLRMQLDNLGVRPGQGVGIRARNGRAFVIGGLAALGCGAVVMPIHHQIKPDEITEMLDKAPLCVIIDDGSGGPLKIPSSTAAAQSGHPKGWTPSEALSNGLRFTRLDNSQALIAPQITDAAFIRFTSGTTGAAKGVVLTHKDILERTAAANSGLNLTHLDTILWVLPMAYHFYVSIILYLEAGSTVLVSSDYLAESILDSATQHRATFLYVTPMHIRLLNSAPAGRTLPPSLQRVMSVSSRLNPQAAKDFHARYQIPVCQGYGIIEVGLPIMNIDEAAEHPEAIGRPVPAFEAMIVSDGAQSETDWQVRPTKDGETGQLALRGPGMFSGYLNPARLRAEIMRDGWFLTGDLAHRDSDGRIVLDGRTSSVIHVAGHKVFPEEVAAVLDSHPAVLRSRVFGKQHPQWGEAVYAEAQLRNGNSNTNGTPVTSDELLTFCRKRLSSQKVPVTVEFVQQVSMTSSGKVKHG